jgi:hypothetical protein
MRYRIRISAAQLIVCSIFCLGGFPATAWSDDCPPDPDAPNFAPHDDENVSLLGRWAAGPCRAVTAVGEIAYCGNGSYLEIVDFGDAELPALRGRMLLPGLIQGVAVAGDLAYVANREAGLRIVDIADPAALVQVGQYDSPGLTLAVAVAGDFAYIADYSGLRIVSVADPADPVPVGYFDT